MKQTSHKKGAAWGSTLMIAGALLATVLAGLLASPPATAQSVPPLYPGPGAPSDPPNTDPCHFKYECGPVGSPTASPTASSTATASPTASPTPTATSTTSPAAKDQYKVPDTAADSSTASPTASPTASATTSPGTQLPPSGGYSLGLVAALALVAFGAVALVLVLVRRAAS
jgi:hypothetical protein